MAAALPGPCDRGVAEASTSSGASHSGATLAASILGSSLAFIDGSVVNVALPTIAGGMAVDPASLPWAINAYLLPLGALILLGGGAGDHYGRRRLFLLGVGLFLAASLLCALAPSFPLLLCGRGLQGVGAALLMPNSLAMLGAAFSGEARGRAIGTWAAVGAIAGAVGPPLGGWLVDVVGWRTIFLLNLPIGAAAAWLAWRYVDETRDRSARALDWSGALLATAGLGLATLALTAAADAGTSRAAVLTLAIGGGALLLAFVLVQRRRGEDALMPLSLFGTRAFIGLTLLTFLLYAALGGLIVMLPYLLIRIGDWSAAAAGAGLLPVPLLIGLGSRPMGRVAARIGGRLPLAMGSAIVAVGLALYLRIASDGLDYWRDVLPATCVVAIGMAITVAPLTTTVMGTVDADHVGAASGFNSAVARIGGLIATALLGFVFVAQSSTAALVAAVHVAAAVGAGLAALASLSAVLLIGPPRRT